MATLYMNKRIWISLGVFIALVIAYEGIDAYLNYRIRHQEPWKLVADCEQDRVTRMKFATTVNSPDGHFEREDRFAVLAKAKDVDEGTSKKKVAKLLGEPSFVEGTTTEDGKFGSCEWHYVLSGKREPSGFFTERQALSIAFDEIGHVKSKSELKR
jgi:SmpA / OmlA family